MIYIFPISEIERTVVQKEYPENKLKIASRRKRKGGSTYYVQCNDQKTLEIIARLRGYQDKIIHKKDGSRYKLLATKQLLKNV